MARRRKLSPAQQKAEARFKELGKGAVGALQSTKRDHSLQAFLNNRGNRGYDFWVLHGVSYLSGVPDRYIQGVYEGKTLYRGGVFPHIFKAHMDGTYLSPEGVMCLLWASLEPRHLYTAVTYVRAFTRRYGWDPHLPRVPYTQMAMKAIGEILLANAEGWEIGVTEEERLQSEKGCARQMRKLGWSLDDYDPRTLLGKVFWETLHAQAREKFSPPERAPEENLTVVTRKWPKGFLAGRQKLGLTTPEEGAPTFDPRRLKRRSRRNTT